MAYIRQRITIINIRKPDAVNINSELQWLASSLGLINLRDKDKSCFRIFIELLKSGKEKHPLSSDEIAFSLSLSRGTVVHHLNKLMESGLVVSEHNRYVLRVATLHALVDEIERDFKRATEELREAASEMDKKLGLRESS
jgi:predicted transcriptional regulator